jgi:MFS family permease
MLGWAMATSSPGPGAPPSSAPEKFNRPLAILLAMAMFVLVVDTSIMNVSISAVVRDLGTTASGVQGAIALEALVSAAFILIGGKTGDLIGRKLAYILGLLGYAIGAIAMTLAQGLTAIIVFWAIIGGIGASLLLPSMQSLIHGNFAGAHQKRVYALVGASAAIAAAVGPLIGGFITTFLSWRVGFLMEAVIIAVVLSGIRLVKDVPYTGSRAIDWGGAALSVVGMGGIVLGILVWQEGGQYVGLLIGVGAVALGSLFWWLRSRKRRQKATLIDPVLFDSKVFQSGVSGQLLQQVALGGTMIVLPLYLQLVLEYNALWAGISIAPLSLTMFVVALIAGRRVKGRPANIIMWGFGLLVVGIAALIPVVPRADSGWWLTIPLIIAGAGLGLLVSQLNNYTLSPISDERVSEAAGVNSAAGSFGLSFGLAFAGAIMLAVLAFTFGARADASTVLSDDQQQQVATVLEEDAQLMSNTGLEELVADEPEAVQDEIIAINTESRPIALQIALCIPLLAGLLGMLNALRMRRLPDPKPSAAAEGVLGA